MDNAAERFNFASEIYEEGVQDEKQRILSALPHHLASLHRNGSLHIHDLEAFGKVHNCCTPDLARYLEDEIFSSSTATGVIFEIVDTIEHLITELALEQSGGIGFGNFDIDLGETLRRRGLQPSEENKRALGDAMRKLVKWVNITQTRYCREPYYVTLNIGLGTGEWDRAVSAALLEAFLLAPTGFTRPNIVFKVSNRINVASESPNRDLYEKALKCTARKMVPTYLLMDGPANIECDPLRLNIMGCRTRVYANVSGNTGSVGRGNIGCVSINLPRIALQAKDLDDFEKILLARMQDCFEILELRKKLMLENGERFLSFVLSKEIWNHVSSVSELVKQGTYSVGFIGVAETVRILDEKGFAGRLEDNAGLQIVSMMAEAVEKQRDVSHENYSLLASAGEGISGRFRDLDAEQYPHRVQDKGFYTNSFHVPVDAGVPMLEKLAREAPFHELCNGGAISYVELGAAPLANIEALDEAIQFGMEKGTSYLGFNFPLDICNSCGNTGTFDTCDACGSDDILRIRRVSGYLEDLSHFTSGKTAEAKCRVSNPN